MKYFSDICGEMIKVLPDLKTLVVVGISTNKHLFECSVRTYQKIQDIHLLKRYTKHRT